MAFEGNGKNAKGLDGMKDPVVVIVGLSVRVFPSLPPFFFPPPISIMSDTPRPF